MYEPSLDTPLDQDLISEAHVAPFPLISIAGSQPNFSQPHAVVPNDSSTDWTMFPLAEVHVHETSHENNASHAFALETATVTFPAAHFAAPAPACGLAGALPCSLPLDDSVKSIRLHLRMHGYIHPQRQTVQCPWIGCSHTLQWGNIPRHIQSIHLGIRFTCSNCGNPYTRLEGLARHTASLKCNGATYAGA